MERRFFSAAPAGEMAMSLAIPATDKGHNGRFYLRNPDEVAPFNRKHRHPRRLQGITFSDSVVATNYLEEAIHGIDVLFLGTPMRALGEFYVGIKDLSKNVPAIVCITKGMQGSLCAAEILEEIDPSITDRLVVLSGPNFAIEIAQRGHSATTVASKNSGASKLVQDVLNTERFRVYTGTDVKGVSYGGAFKNVIAIASGMLEGLGVNDFLRTIVISKGLVEMMQLGEANGAEPNTFLGLSGVGDFIVTCNSKQSRNFRAGIALTQGATPEALFHSDKTIEGIYTAQSVMELIKRSGNLKDYPIMTTVWRVLYGGLDPQEAGRILIDSR